MNQQNKRTVAQSKLLYDEFLLERKLILQNIKEFLYLVLNFQHESDKRAKPSSLNNAEDVRKLIKSLCLIHALYGYPGEEKGNVLNSYWG